MAYGAGALNEQQMDEMRQKLMVHPLNDTEYRRGMNQIITGTPRGNMFNFHKPKYSLEQEEARRLAFENQNKILRSAAGQSYKEGNIRSLTMASINKSSWLKRQAIPEETDIDAKIDKATDTFGIERMSKSQKTKRGKKFNKKAQFQAKMINTMGECNYQRENSIKRLTYEGIDGWIGNEEEGFAMEDDLKYFSNIGDRENVDIIAPIMQDIAFLQVQQVGEIRISDNPALRNGYMLEGDLAKNTEVIGKLATPETRNAVFEDTIKAFDRLDIDKFNYESDEEFAKNTGRNRFQLRYAELKAYSHVGTMLRILDEDSKKGTGYEMPKDIGDRLDQLHRKVRLLQDILADYDNRVLLLQSPYYVLLASKDFDSISNDELRRRIGTTEDLYARTYMQLELDRRENKGFKKGASASKLLKANKINKDDITEKDINDYVTQNAHPRTIDIAAAMKTQPYIVYFNGEEKEHDSLEFREKVRRMHRDLNSSSQAERWHKLSARDVALGHENIALYEAAGAGDLYNVLLADQQVLEDFRARIDALTQMEKAGGFRQSQVITGAMIRLIEEYKTARDKFIADYSAVEEKVRSYQKKFGNN
ncbi:MAG: hypothetical protein K5770_10895 [Lachnospiraceae bacterium]|nr:hypothetical protein [Lachnospiraceae bacterium]